MRVAWGNKNVAPIFTVIFILLINSSAHADTISLPERKKETTETYVEYEWWLLNWAENELACKIVVEHDGSPTFDDIFLGCGLDILSTWLDHPLCGTASNGGDTSLC